MPREVLERELKHLEDEVLEMGAQVEKSLLESVEMLKQRDLEGSRRIMFEDRAVNQKRFAFQFCKGFILPLRVVLESAGLSPSQNQCSPFNHANQLFFNWFLINWTSFSPS